MLFTATPYFKYQYKCRSLPIWRPSMRMNWLQNLISGNISSFFYKSLDGFAIEHHWIRANLAFFFSLYFVLFVIDFIDLVDWFRGFEEPSRLTLTLFMLRMLPQSSMYCFRSFSRYSKTNVSDFSVWTMSCNVTATSFNQHPLMRQHPAYSNHLCWIQIPSDFFFHPYLWYSSIY